MLPDDTLLGGLYIIKLSEFHFYGGRTFCFQKRWKEHLQALQQGVAGSRMQRVYDKFGVFEPEILEILPREQQPEAEQKWLDANFGKPGCVNLSPFSHGGCLGHSPESREKMSKAVRPPITPESIAKRKATWASRPDLRAMSREQLRKNFCWKGVKKSPEQIRKMREASLGKKQSPETISKRVLKIIGRKNSPETLARMSESAKIRAVLHPTKHGEETRALISSQQTGRIWINNGSVKTRVPGEELQGYLDQGWVLGQDRHHAEEFREAMSENMSNRTWLTDGDKNLFVKPDQVEALQAAGWTQGRSNIQPTPAEARKKSGAKRHGRVWATDGTDNLLVSPDEIPPGWKLGLTKKIGTMSDEMKAAVSAKRRGRVWLNDGGHRSTCVDADQVQRYLDEGWSRGRLPVK